MEQNFQTSFIPKKPMIEKRVTASRSVSIFTIASIFILFTVILSTGGLYLYQASLTKNIAEQVTELNLAKGSFEPSKITELEVLDKRLRASTQILANHVVVTPIFDALSTITMKTVRYTKFSYSLADGTNANILVKMSGVAVGYRSIALQSDLFATNKNLIDPVFSNLTLDDAGNVDFELQFSVDPSFINYKQNIQATTS